jgi:hypothetical protein
MVSLCDAESEKQTSRSRKCTRPKGLCGKPWRALLSGSKATALGRYINSSIMSAAAERHLI